jgi:aspartate kinase
VGRDGTKDISFTVSRAHAPEAVELLGALDILSDLRVICDTAVAKISVVGAGMETHPGTASQMFEALFAVDINIQMISTSEIKISVLIDEADADRAVASVHRAFFPET